jgi:hypothetical protein
MLNTMSLGAAQHVFRGVRTGRRTCDHRGGVPVWYRQERLWRDIRAQRFNPSKPGEPLVCLRTVNWGADERKP